MDTNFDNEDKDDSQSGAAASGEQKKITAVGLKDAIKNAGEDKEGDDEEKKEEGEDADKEQEKSEETTDVSADSDDTDKKDKEDKDD